MQVMWDARDIQGITDIRRLKQESAAIARNLKYAQAHEGYASDAIGVGLLYTYQQETREEQQRLAAIERQIAKLQGAKGNQA
jgi:hypothetical protein